MVRNGEVHSKIERHNQMEGRSKKCRGMDRDGWGCNKARERDGEVSNGRAQRWRGTERNKGQCQRWRGRVRSVVAWREMETLMRYKGDGEVQ